MGWFLVDTEPYVRRDGSLTELWVWQRPCRYCGTPFRVKAPPATLDSGSFAAVHCQACKDPKAVARGRARVEAWKRKNANTQETTRTTGAPQTVVHVEPAQDSVHHCTTTAPRCTVVQGQSACLHHEVRDPLARGPAVVQRCGARCGAVGTECAKVCVQFFADSK